MNIINRNINELIEAEYNPRNLTKSQHKQLKDSLHRFGVVDPVLVNINKERKNVIIGGHQRVRVWGDLGNTTIPCIELDLSPEKEKELNIRLNKNTGEFDFDMLANYFEQDDLADWGFDALYFNDNDDLGLTDEDVDLEQEFDPIGSSEKEHKIVITFNTIDEANSWVLSHNYSEIVKKQGSAWQIKIDTLSI